MRERGLYGTGIYRSRGTYRNNDAGCPDVGPGMLSMSDRMGLDMLALDPNVAMNNIVNSSGTNPVTNPMGGTSGTSSLADVGAMYASMTGTALMNNVMAMGNMAGRNGTVPNIGFLPGMSGGLNNPGLMGMGSMWTGAGGIGGANTGLVSGGLANPIYGGTGGSYSMAGAQGLLSTAAPVTTNDVIMRAPGMYSNAQAAPAYGLTAPMASVATVPPMTNAATITQAGLVAGLPGGFASQARVDNNVLVSMPLPQTILGVAPSLRRFVTESMPTAIATTAWNLERSRANDGVVMANGCCAGGGGLGGTVGGSTVPLQPLQMFQRPTRVTLNASVAPQLASARVFGAQEMSTPMPFGIVFLGTGPEFTIGDDDRANWSFFSATCGDCFTADDACIVQTDQGISIFQKMFTLTYPGPCCELPGPVDNGFFNDFKLYLINTSEAKQSDSTMMPYEVYMEWIAAAVQYFALGPAGIAALYNNPDPLAALPLVVNPNADPRVGHVILGATAPGLGLTYGFCFTNEVIYAFAEKLPLDQYSQASSPETSSGGWRAIFRLKNRDASRPLNDYARVGVGLWAEGVRFYIDGIEMPMAMIMGYGQVPSTSGWDAITQWAGVNATLTPVKWQMVIRLGTFLEGTTPGAAPMTVPSMVGLVNQTNLVNLDDNMQPIVTWSTVAAAQNALLYRLPGATQEKPRSMVGAGVNISTYGIFYRR